MMVMTGIILLLSARMLKRKEHTPNGISFGRMFGYVVLPCALLGLWATLFSRHRAMGFCPCPGSM
jgi:hypothetical protein